ncbi:MAG: CoB--CoM heterodisulfide reductase iron-sulfur subunit B family protein [Candidatus Krumholzibacteria bacterium]|jgi:heterodisulfide reductase subunit B|nr:CoB--CoM heterodisulfide reductase iron-sulfur subunit B family protein [Candidatus Krumholzibacteria bacterium]
MKLGFYPGCSLEGSSREYNESVMAVAAGAGIELEPVPDWNCCGATAAHNMNRELGLSLPARILAKAEAAGMKEIVVPCAACYSRLKVTRHELLEDEELRRRISAIIEYDLRCEPEIINVLQFLDSRVMPAIEGRIKSPFDRRVACYYGCLLVRPHKILKFDRLEDPRSMDEIIRRIGGDPIDWAFKTECCGAGLSVSKTELVGRLSGRILEDARIRGAEAVIVACPMCHSNLDLRRGAIEKAMNRKYDMPAIFITQAVGLAMGIDPAKLGLNRHMVPVKFRERPAGKVPAGPESPAAAGEV